MVRDLKSSVIFAISRALAAIDVSVATTSAGAAVDLSQAASVSFIGDVGTITGGTLAVKVQYSNDNSTWHDETDTHYGNDTTTGTLDATGKYELHVPNPHARYYRTYATAATADVTSCEISALGMLNSIDPN